MSSYRFIRSSTSGPGPGGRPGQRICSRTLVSTPASPWPRSHFRLIRPMISRPDRRPTTSGYKVRKRRSAPASSAGISASPPPESSHRASESRWASAAVRMRSSFASPSPCAASAQHLDHCHLHTQRQPRPPEQFLDQTGVADPDRGVGDAGLAQSPVGQPNRLGVSAGRPRLVEPLDADLVELSEHARTRRQVAEHGPRIADPPGQSRRLGGVAIGTDDPGRHLGAEANRVVPALDLIQIGDDPCAPLFRSWSARSSSTGTRIGRYPAAGEPVEQERLEPVRAGQIHRGGRRPSPSPSHDVRLCRPGLRSLHHS